MGYFITISGSQFSPLNLHVPPGGTVTVENNDGMSHSVTSEAAPDAFVVGSVAGVSFDTGQFLGRRSFSVPASAPNGTAIPYFCTTHMGTMVTRNGTITVDAAAQPFPDPGGGGGGSGY
jgi:plastocyanin